MTEIIEWHICMLCLRRPLSIFSLNVNAIWKLLRTVYQRMFLLKCYIRLLFIYSEVSQLWYQRKVKGNTWFSLWSFKRVCTQKGLNCKMDLKEFFSHNWILQSHVIVSWSLYCLRLFFCTFYVLVLWLYLLFAKWKVDC